MKILVTGGAGFIGSNFIHYILKTYPRYEVINLDLLTYAGNLDNLRDIGRGPRYHFIQGDIGDFQLLTRIFEDYQPDMVVNFAAQSHNDRAVNDPKVFLLTNVLGTQNLLETAKRYRVLKRFHHISTCEVYGDLPLSSKEKFTEISPYRPRTPYNASKAAADHVVRAYFHTFRLPITISNCANNYGPYQFPEKIIPLFLTNALEAKPLPLFKHSKNKREYIHVLDHCRGIDLIVHKGKPGETYNIGSGVEKSIEEVADTLLRLLHKPKSLKHYVPDRVGHDRRYLLDYSKIEKELGYTPRYDFEKGIKETVDWYKENRWWWSKIKRSREFQEYYKRQYGNL